MRAHTLVAVVALAGGLTTGTLAIQLVPRRLSTGSRPRPVLAKDRRVATRTEPQVPFSARIGQNGKEIESIRGKRGD
jgi:hypothetical protein